MNKNIKLVEKMPYKYLKDLPQKVRRVLPVHAQKIYLKVYNKATEEYKNPKKIRGNGKTRKSSEIVAHKVAWTAVKKKYKKENVASTWIKK